MKSPETIKKKEMPPEVTTVEELIFFLKELLRIYGDGLLNCPVIFEDKDFEDNNIANVDVVERGPSEVAYVRKVRLS